MVFSTRVIEKRIRSEGNRSGKVPNLFISVILVDVDYMTFLMRALYIIYLIRYEAAEHGPRDQ